MTFVTTWLAIAGAAAVSIPIIIHLLSRQRRRPIEWAAMRFLLEAMRKHKRRLQLQQLLLLATRCLIVLLLGAALARPILSQAGLLAGGGNRAVFLVIDNGMAAGVQEGEASALEAHIQQAQRIIGALDAGDRVGVITAARPARALLAPPSSDHASVLALLRSLEPADAPTDLAGAVRALRGSLDAAADDFDHTFVYLLSEFRAGSAPVDSPLPAVLRDLGPRVTLLAAEPSQSRVGNVQIASIDPVRSVIVPGAADGSGQITVRLARHGDELAGDVSRVRLSIANAASQGPGTPVPGLSPAAAEPRIVRWEPGQSQASVDFLLNLDGADERELALTARLDDDALNADNARHAVLTVRRQIRVVMLERRTFGFEASIDRYRAAEWVRRALEPHDRSGGAAGVMQIIDAEPAALSVADVRAADVVVASRPDLVSDSGWDVLRDFVDAGGLLIVMPPGELNVHQWAERFTSRFDLSWRIGLEAREYADGVFMSDEQPPSELLRMISADLNELAHPVVTSRAMPVEIGEGGGAVALSLADGAPMLLTGSPPAVRAERHAAGDGGDVVNPSRGLVVFFTVAPELGWTSLPSKPLMVPLMQELVRQGLSSIHASYAAIAGDVPAFPAAAHRAAVEVIDPAGERIALDAAHRPHRPLTRAGAYELRDAAASRLGSFAVNVDPAAGRTEPQPAVAVQAWLGGSASPGAWSSFAVADPAAPFRAAASGAPLAAILLLIVLALVMLETMLARWFSHSSEAEAGEQAFSRNVQTSKRPNVHIEPVHATLR